MALFGTLCNIRLRPRHLENICEINLSVLNLFLKDRNSGRDRVGAYSFGGLGPCPDGSHLSEFQVSPAAVGSATAAQKRSFGR